MTRRSPTPDGPRPPNPNPRPVTWNELVSTFMSLSSAVSQALAVERIPRQAREILTPGADQGGIPRTSALAATRRVSIWTWAAPLRWGGSFRSCANDRRIPVQPRSFGRILSPWTVCSHSLGIGIAETVAR